MPSTSASQPEAPPRVMDTSTQGGATCPSCRMPFDKGKKRKLIDSCGHERCYSCMFNNDRCPLCSMTNAVTTKISKTLNPTVAARPGLKTNGHFTAFMRGRRQAAAGPEENVYASVPRPGFPKDRPPTSPLPARTSWSQRRHRPQPLLPPPPLPPPASNRHSSFSVLQGWPAEVFRKIRSLWSLDEEPSAGPPPAPECARNDLIVRLGLLLGDRGAKNPFASTSSLTGSEATGNTSPLSTLTVSSGSGGPDRRQDAGSDSMASLMSSGSMPYENGVRYAAPSVLCADVEDAESRIRLKPLFFEVPCADEAPPFVGRQWLFDEMEEALQSGGRGVILSGGIGTGKTSVVLQLVERSCFGRRKDEPLYYEICDRKSPGLGLGAPEALGCRVVAFHFCQADDNATCSVPDFVHGLAAQMCQSPRLAAYRESLLAAPALQGALSMRECVADPSRALATGVLEPLRALEDAGKISAENACLVLVDALNEAEFHRPDFGDTIASFLARHSPKFPSWLKLVLTVRSAMRDVTKRFPFRVICLDDDPQRDLFEYVSYRIGRGAAIRANVAPAGCSTANFTQHLLRLSKGCLLYAKLVLDLVERGSLVMKSAGYKVLPISLAQVYLLHFNLTFPSVLSFRKAEPILSCCLASLYPLNVLEIYHTVNSGFVDAFVAWEDFAQRMDTLAAFLVRRRDGTYMYFHPSFREWLVHRPPGESSDFLCDSRLGHANIAFRLSRLEYPLAADKVLELGHHILKAHIYKAAGRDPPVPPRDAQALWVCLATDDVSAALVAPRNLFSPNVKVSRLLLLAGADPNRGSGELSGAPPLGVAAHEGLVDMALTLLEFGADADAACEAGVTPLMHACANNRVDVVKLLLARGASVDRADRDGMYPLSHAARNAHLQTVSFLTQYLRPDGPWGQGSVSCRARTVRQALVAAALNGRTVVCEFLLNLADVRVNAVDETCGETALTAACSRGMRETCAFLVRRGAAAATVNAKGAPPLCCAAREGHREVALHLLNQAAAVDQVDGDGATALMHAAANGHHALARDLLVAGASVSRADGRGLSALCRACLGGHLQAAAVLLDHGSSVHHCDSKGRTPLDVAAAHGDSRLVQLLLGHGAAVEHVDHSGTRPLDRAIECKNSAAVLCFLKKGAKLGPATWEVAADKPDIMLILLNKLMDDGMALYKKSRLRDAAYRFQYALKKFPTTAVVGDLIRPFEQLKLNLLLNLSRSHRKMNEPEAAVRTACEALDANPGCYEAYYARARARRDLGQPKAALEDATEAVKLAPENKELRRVVDKLEEEARRAGET